MYIRSYNHILSKEFESYIHTYIAMYVYVYIFNICIYSVYTVYTVLYVHRSTLYTYYALKYLRSYRPYLHNSAFTVSGYIRTL